MYVMRKIKLDYLDKILFCVFTFALIVYIFLWFKGYQLQEVTIGGIGGEQDIPLLQSYKTLFALSIVVITCVSCLRYKIKMLYTGKLLLVWAFYMLLLTFLNMDNKTIANYCNQFTSMSLWIFVYLFVYSFYLRYGNVLNVNKYVILLVVYFLVLFMLNYITVKSVGISWAMIESYYFIMMIPFVLLLSFKWRFLLLFLILIGTVLAAKRTGTLACVISLFLYFLLIGRNFLKKVKMIFVALIMVFLFYEVTSHFFKDQFIHLVERYVSISEDGGSGREEVFPVILDMILTSDLEDIIFGHGYNMVIEDSPYRLSAHNDFLEVTYDYGILGLLIYLLFYYSIFSKIRRVGKHEIKVAIFLSGLLLFVVSLASHLILFPTSIICLCIFWGYIDGAIVRNEI